MVKNFFEKASNEQNNPKYLKWLPLVDGETETFISGNKAD